MRAKQLAGLVTAGGIGRSFVSRMPRLLAEVGPVKATSYRVARRIVNSLHKGQAVKEYSGLESCRLIWIAVPETVLDSVIQDLAARRSFEGRIVVLCGSAQDVTALSVLHARVASLNALPESEERTLVAEGHEDALHELRRLAAAEKRTLIEMRTGRKALYVAGVHLASDLVLPWIGAAVESMRAAGFSRAAATRAVEAMSTRALHAYTKAGRKAWSFTASESLEEIRGADPQLAELYLAGVAIGLRYFR